MNEVSQKLGEAGTRNVALAKAKKSIDHEIDARVAQYLLDLPAELDKLLDKTLGDAIGVDTSWHDKRVKDGSLIANYIQAKAKKMVEEAVDKILTQEYINEQMGKIEAALKNRFDDCLQSACRSYASDSAEKQIQKAGYDYVQQFTTAIKLDPVTTEIDIQNPKTGDKAVELIIMKELVESLPKEGTDECQTPNKQ